MPWKDKEKNAASQRKYYHENKEKMSAKWREKYRKYYQEHKEEISKKRRDQYRKYYQEHKEHSSERHKRYYQEHKEEIAVKRREKYKEYYQKHKETWRLRGRSPRRREKEKLVRCTNRDELRSIKEKEGCYDCKKRFPHYVLEFHHKDSKSKKYGVTEVICSKNLMKEELSKCVVLCANCHKARHYFERIANGVAKGTRTGLHVSSERQVHEGTCISGSHDR